MMDLCGPSRIEKVRFTVPQGKLTWEIDVFGGRHEGLIVAEVELMREDEALKLPTWIGEEVTNNSSYRNSKLVDEG
jgi:CYTH domain-containing protein